MDSIPQSLLPLPIAHPTIPVRQFNRLQDRELSQRLADAQTVAFGLSVKLSRSGKLEYVAFATPEQVYLMKVEKTDGPPSAMNLRSILNGSRFTLAGFEMAKLALDIHRGLEHRVRGVDLSTLLSASTRRPWSPSTFVVERLSSAARRLDIEKLWEGDPECGFREVCLRAWLSAIAAKSCMEDVNSALKVDTGYLKPEELKIFETIVLQATLLRNERPKEVKNEFSSIDDATDGELVLHNSRYKNRARASEQTSVVFTNERGVEFVGRAKHAHGKQTRITLQGHISGTIESVRIVGREELTQSERARDEFVLLVLREERNPRESSFIEYLWFSPPAIISKDQGISAMVPLVDPYIRGLNDSQRGVVGSMLHEDIPLIIAHGPPGTGKTSTISAAVKLWDQRNTPVWVVAQSNVAVKNIAESLVKREVDFKLIVSPEFYVEWHEHIYEKIQQHLLLTDELPPDPGAAERTIGGSPIILCTLSMLSNPLLEDRKVYQVVPVEVLIVDEASQIDIGEYMHLFHKFKRLRKVCFFGDPKQLPPYGKDTVSSLQSVFEIKHLRGRAHFLNTQYRMPTPLGAFISDEVYNGKLRSEHKISNLDCVAFVDVGKGQEMQIGTSWTNPAEAQTIVHLVDHYYRNLDFCVITPYDAQRAAIENQLKAANVPWERVFNVDSFQGNEAEYVIISVVRTTGPGFLTSQNRVNVMLTRCKVGMVIVTNKVFLRTTGAQYTLLGNLAQRWAKSRGEVEMWVDWRQIVEQTADMPGVRGRLKPQQASPIVPFSKAIVMSSAAKPPVTSAVICPAMHPPPPKQPTINHFPTLGPSASSKSPVIAWNSPTALKAIKNINTSRRMQAASPIPSPAIRIAPFPSARNADKPVDQFPSLTNDKGEKKVQGKWKNGSAPAKALR